MKTNHILATGLLAGIMAFGTAKSQELTEVPVDSSLVKGQPTQSTDTLLSVIPVLPVKYNGTDSIYNETPIKQTIVPGLTEKQIKNLNKKYPDGISVNSNAFDMTVEDSLNVLDVMDKAVAYTIKYDSLNAEEKNFINYEAYRIRKSIDDAAKSYNEIVNDGKLTTKEISNILQPKYALPTAELNRLKESLPEDSYELILSAQNSFNSYIGRVTSTAQSAVEEALKTTWYKRPVFLIPAGAATGTAAYFLGKKAKGTEQKGGVNSGGTGVY